MFIELTPFNSTNKIAININNITDFIENDGCAWIYTIGQTDYPIKVNESYEVVKNTIIKMNSEDGGFTWKR